MTPQPHDFKDALASLDAFNKAELQKFNVNGTQIKAGTDETFYKRSDCLHLEKQRDTIRFALRLAERVCGEMSDDMAELIAKECRCCGGIAESLYHAIKKQIIKEIENG